MTCGALCLGPTAGMVAAQIQTQRIKTTGCITTALITQSAQNRVER